MYNFQMIGRNKMNLLKKTQSVQKKAKNLGERSIEKVRPIENLRWKILFKLISNTFTAFISISVCQFLL